MFEMQDRIQDKLCVLRETHCKLIFCSSFGSLFNEIVKKKITIMFKITGIFLPEVTNILV
jgi:hypothetical protein